MMLSAIRGLALALPVSCLAAGAQPQPTARAPLFAAVLSAGTTRAIHYPFLDGSVLIDFQGTALDPAAQGDASIRGQGGNYRIRAHFRALGPASRFGPEFLTYVLWSVSPMGRCVNLGEVAASGGRARVEALTFEPTFALIVTAEPHFAVTRMSHAVVLENVPRRRTRHAVEEVEARYELMPRGTYALEANAVADGAGGRISPYVFQARNAVRIARQEGAETLAASELKRAQEYLASMEAEKALWKKDAVLWARRTIQQAEDARLVAARHKESRALEEQRELAVSAQLQAEAAKAEAEANQRLAEEEARRAHSQERAAVEARRKATDVQLALRRTLLERMNRLLRTREMEDGLQATLTDVAFPSGRSRLSPGARENLAKVAGILLAHPGLKVKVLGHADSTGNPAFNDRLSRDRAEEVRRFLAEQGLPGGAMEAQGMGSAHPVASNATPQGRRQNRRVDLMISGEPIGL